MSAALPTPNVIARETALAARRLGVPERDVRFVIVCDVGDYRSAPMTYEHALRRLAWIREAGSCNHNHHLEPTVRRDPVL